MSIASSSDFLDFALSLPEEQRLHLATELLASIKPPGVMSVDDPRFLDEIRRRSEEIDRGEAETVSVDEALQSIREALRAQRTQ